MRRVGSGIKGVGSGIRRVGSGIAALGSGITDHVIGISSFLRDQGLGCTYLWVQGRKLVMLLESRIINLLAKMGSVMKNIPLYHLDLEPSKRVASSRVSMCFLFASVYFRLSGPGTLISLTLSSC